MPTNKPTQYLQWNPSQSAVVQPPDSLRARGYAANEAPTNTSFNWLFWLTDSWISYFDGSLSSAVMTTTLDSSMRLVGGGTLSFTLSSGVFAWSAPLNLSIPSVPDADNQIAAGNVIAAPGSVLYVQANYPFTSAGDVTSGTSTINNVPFTNGISAGQAVTGAGIASGTTVVSVSGNTVTLSQPATASNQQTPVTYAGTGPLTIQAAPVAQLVPSANTVILGRATSTALFIGVNSGQVILRDGEQRRLLEAGYHDVRYLVAGVALAARQTVYISTAVDNRTQGAVYPVDASQAQGLNRSLCIGVVTTATASGGIAPVMTGGVLGGFTGLTQGAIFYSDPTVIGALTTTRPTGGNYAVPVGVALDATNLYVRIASTSGAPLLDPSFNSVTVAPVAGDTAPVQFVIKDATGVTKILGNTAGALSAQSVSSAAGFRSGLSQAMIQYAVTASTTPGANGNSPINMAETNNFANWTQRMAYSGSLTGSSISFRHTTAQTNPISLGFIIIKNGATNTYSPGVTAPSGSANSDFVFAEGQAKGAFPFAAGDLLTMQWYSATQFSAACTLYAKVVIYAEFTA